MKIHRPILLGVHKALAQIFIEHKHAELVVDSFLKSEKKWGARDRRQFAEIVYDVVRNLRLLFVFAIGDVKFDHLSLTQDELEKIVDKYTSLEPNDLLEFGKKFPRVVKYSLPDWLDELLQAECGERWEDLSAQLHQKAKQYLRVNTLKAKRNELVKELAGSGVPVSQVKGVETALVLDERKNVFITEAFKRGAFEMQDVGSQFIAPFVRAEVGSRVVDACAGAGGKTLHLAMLMQNQGQIIALDIHEWKLNELKLRARRAGVSNIETRLIDSTKVIKRLAESADFVLLDVPCSGLGVLRRHPDTKWKLSLQQLEELKTTQAEILKSYTQMAKVGGNVVYATCSLLPSENEEQVNKFVSESGGAFEIEEQKSVLPQDYDCDAFYMARLRRVQ